MSKRSKYILLKKARVHGDDENEPVEIPRGEILEEVCSDSDFWKGVVDLYDVRGVKLTCPTNEVARLTDLDADDLLRIRSLEQRLAKFQARNCFGEPPRRGNQVFVAVRGREFKGIVRAVPKIDDNVSFFGVQFFNEVLEEDCIHDGTFKTCEPDMLFHLPNGGVGVSVSLDKLRPRYERKETLPKYHTRAGRAAVNVERLLEFDGYLNLIGMKSYQKSIELETLFAAEKEANAKTRKDLIISEQKLNKSEKELARIEQICRELELKLNEPQRQSSCTQKAKEEAEKRLQGCEEKTKEPETAPPMVPLEQYKKLELELDKLRQQIACEQKAKEEAEKRLQEEAEKRLQGCEEKTKEPKTAPPMVPLEQYKKLELESDKLRQQIACEQKATEEAEKRLQEEAEKRLQGCEEKTKEPETAPPMVPLEQYKKLELESDKLRQQIACEQKAKEETEKQKGKEEAEKRLQICQKEKKELETTLATAQKLLEGKQESENECDWILNRKEIILTEEELGRGTFGTVYKGIFRGTEVAVKKVSVKPRITEYNIGNFRREMKMASRCRHPCMLQFIGATSDDQCPLLVTELLDTSLKAILIERALDLVEVITIALDVAKGLNYLHLNNPHPIVHRDISSGNVLLWKHGQSWRGKISDYGNCVLMNYAKTGSGGALSYLAPEMNHHRFSTKSDVYSYGVLTLEKCLRKEPSCSDNSDELICKVEDGELRKLIRSCLEQVPKQRPSMEKVVDVLELLKRQATINGTKHHTSKQNSQISAKKKRCAFEQRITGKL